MLGLRPELDELVRSVLVGRPAPPLAVTRLADGTQLTLDDWAGQIVVVDFWATWCWLLEHLHRRTNQLNKAMRAIEAKYNKILTKQQQKIHRIQQRGQEIIYYYRKINQRVRPDHEKPKSVTPLKNLTQIQGIGPSIVKKFEKAGIKSLEEIYEMDVDDLATINGIGGKTAENIVKSLRKLLEEVA